MADRRSELGSPEKSSIERKVPSSSSPFPYARMENKWDALDRLDLQFRWGDYGIKVLRCHLTLIPPGHIINFHKHSEYEFHFIPKGKGKVIIEDQPYDVHEGLFYVTAPDVVHYQESDPHDPMHELCLHCDIIPLTEQEWGGRSSYGMELEAAEAHECISILSRSPARPVTDRYHAMNSFLDAYRAWEEKSLGYYTLMKQAIIQILQRSARMFDDIGSKSGIPERDMNFHRYQMATQYIEDNESLPITLEQVAERINISSRQLQRIFRSEGRTTFRDYLEHVRLTLICADLLNTDLPVEEIALDHGYSNPNYLYSVFKNKHKMTPNSYRKFHKKSNSERKSQDYE